MKDTSTLQSQPVTAIILAAGISTRFNEGHKLLEGLNGTTVIERTIGLSLASPVDETIVVTGFQSDRVASILDALNVRPVFNPDFESGIASSIVCGVRAARPDHHVLIWPGDMPLVSAETVGRIVERRHPEAIVVPVLDGRRGHPVFFGRSFKEQLLLLDGDRGARSVLHRNPESVVEVAVADKGTVIDIDTWEDLRSATQMLDSED